MKHWWWLAALLLVTPAHAASPVAVCGLSGTSSQSNCIAPASDGSIPVTGSFSASFAPTGAATLSVTSSTGRVALPNSDASLLVQNTGSTNAFFKLGNSSVTAATTDYSLPAGYQITLAAGSNTHLAAITASSTTTIKIIQGTGTPNIAGGGSGGGGTLSATATAAAPSYSEGASVALSTDLAGNTRTILPSSQVLVTGTAGSASTQVLSVQGIASMTPVIVTGSGAAGTAATGVVTVQGIASMTPLLANPGTAGNWGVGATGSAPPANGIYAAGNGSGATGGLLAGLKTCDLHAKYDASDNGSITLVTGVSSRKVYICGYIMAVGSTATNLKLREGSDANCASNAADLTPAYQLTANQSVGAMSAFWTGLAVSTNAYYVCINASAGNAHQAELWYTIQ